MCPGHPDKNFVEMLIAKKGKIMSKNGKDVVATIDSAVPVLLNGDIYAQTVRKSSCEVLTNDTKCEQCVNYRDTLRKSFHRWKKRKDLPPSRDIASTSHTNLRYLNTPEKRQRYRKLKVRSDMAEQKMTEKLTEKNGIELESDMRNDIEGIMTDMTGIVRNEHSEGSFRRIFWEQQLQALQKKRPSPDALASCSNKMVLAPEV